MKELEKKQLNFHMCNFLHITTNNLWIWGRTVYQGEPWDWESSAFSAALSAAQRIKDRAGQKQQRQIAQNINKACPNVPLVLGGE